MSYLHRDHTFRVQIICVPTVQKIGDVITANDKGVREKEQVLLSSRDSVLPVEGQEDPDHPVLQCSHSNDIQSVDSYVTV